MTTQDNRGAVEGVGGVGVAEEVTVALTRAEAETLSRGGWTDHPVAVYQSAKKKLRIALAEQEPTDGSGGEL